MLTRQALVRRSKSSAATRRAKRSLFLEALEDRSLMATLTVNTSADTTAGDNQLSFREAIAAVNAQSSAGLDAGAVAQINTTEAFGTNDTVNFASSLANQTITVAAALPVTETVIINITDGTQTVDLQISAQITGDVGDQFTKDGAGTLAIASTNTATYLGLIVAQAGTLLVDGTVGDVRLNGGTLGGVGTVGDGNVAVDAISSSAVGGVVNPGDNGPGILHTNGNLTWNANTSFFVELNRLPAYPSALVAGTDYDQLRVNGNINLNNANLTGAIDQLGVGILTASPTGPDTFTILTYTGIRTGKFASGDQVFIQGRKFLINYDDLNKQVVLTTLPKDIVSPGGSAPGILQVTGNVTWDANTTFVVDLNRLNAYPAPLVAGTDYDQLQVTGNITLTNATLDGVINSIGVGILTTSPTGPDTFTILTYTGIRTGKFASGDQVFIQGRKFLVNYDDLNKQIVLTKVQAATSIDLVSSAPTSVFGQPVVFTATVGVVAPGSGVPTGDVIFTVDGTAQPPVPLNGSGVATLSTNTLSVGSHTILVDYQGDADFGISSDSMMQTVNQSATTTNVVSSVNPSVFGQPVTFTATVGATAPGSGIPTGNVIFTIGGVAQAPIPLNGSGVASLTTNATPVGSQTIQVAYQASTNFATSNGSVLQNVNQSATTTTVGSSAATSVFGQTVTFTATVGAVAPGSGVPTGNVIFTIGGIAQPPVALNGSGVASLTTNTLQVGSPTIQAAYQGDTNFATSNGSVMQTVNQSATTTTVAPSLNPSVFGQPVTFTATVGAVAPGSGVPTGNVIFTIGGIAQPPVPLNGSGVASLTTNAIPAGTNAIQAAYQGSTNFAISNFSGVQNVNQSATTTTVGSSAPTSVFGQPVIFTATVGAVAPGSGVPTGSVIFTIDGIPQAPVALNGSGMATLTTNTLSVGSPTVQVAYSGNTNFATSNGSVMQTVNQSATTTTVGSSADPSNFGQSVTFTATVDAVAPGSGVPTGDVIFTIGGIAQAPVALDASGVASLTTNAIPVGNQTIEVDYLGDSNFATSNDSVVQTVNALPGPGTASIVGRTLFVNGTSRSDAIVVQQFSPTHVRVIAFGRLFSTFALSRFDNIEIYGNAGSDAIVTFGRLKPTLIRGGAGNDAIVTGDANDVIFGDDGVDSIVSGGGNDIVVGGNGTDYIVGGAGRDLLIGGNSFDNISGLDGDDILIGGRTVHDGDIAALQGILAIWTSAGSFSDRITALGGELNETTVQSDGTFDFIFGNQGRDWQLDYSNLDFFFDFNSNSSTGDRKN